MLRFRNRLICVRNYISCLLRSFHVPVISFRCVILYTVRSRIYCSLFLLQKLHTETLHLFLLGRGQPNRDWHLGVAFPRNVSGCELWTWRFRLELWPVVSCKPGSTTRPVPCRSLASMKQQHRHVTHTGNVRNPSVSEIHARALVSLYCINDDDDVKDGLYYGEIISPWSRPVEKRIKIGL